MESLGMRQGLFVLVTVLGVMCGLSSVRAAERNHCGCYQTDVGTCVCDKKAQCGCPGECEPQGCEAQRDKAFQKEVEAETKRAREMAKKHSTPEKDESAGRPAMVPAAATQLPRSRALSDAQTKQLVRFLDLYFHEHPDARSSRAGELRDKLAHSHN